VSLSTGQGFTSPQIWLVHGLSTPEQMQYADVNGDGMHDALYFDTFRSNGIWVSLSRGSWFEKPKEWLRHGPSIPDQIKYVDVNGDRKADAIYNDSLRSMKLWLSLSLGSQFSTPVPLPFRHSRTEPDLEHDAYPTQKSGMPYGLDVNLVKSLVEATREDVASSQLYRDRDYEVLDFRANRLELQLKREESKASWLYLAIPWHSFWRAYVDGERVPIAVANLGYQAVPVEGDSHVLLQFESKLLTLIHLLLFAVSFVILPIPYLVWKRLSDRES
jgi:hypothetical protein